MVTGIPSLKGPADALAWTEARAPGRGSRPSRRHRGLELCLCASYLSVQAVTYLGPQPPGLQARRPELTQAEFRFLSEEVGRAAWGSGGGVGIPQLFLLRRKAGFQRNSWEPLALHLPPSPTAPEEWVGLMLTHLKALSTGQPPRSHSAPPSQVSSWSVTCEGVVRQSRPGLAIQPRNPKDRNLPSGEETQAQGEDVASRLPPPQGLASNPSVSQSAFGSQGPGCHEPLATSLGHMETAMQKSRGRQADAATKL